VLVVHASPGTDDGPGLRDTQTDDEVRELIAGADAGLIVVGHTHLPVDRTVDGVRIWNLGSVSMPFTDDVRAMWTLLEADESGYRLGRHYAEYDIDAMLAAAAAVGHPAIDLLRRTWDKG
jgi:diadenosine tetraphosphatase ApaH/serine/threonine PP2A family protein phosphatase